MKLDDLIVYQLAMEIADEIWFLVDKWEPFAKWTTGKQLVDTSDSMASNILPRLTKLNHHLVNKSQKPKTNKRRRVY